MKTINTIALITFAGLSILSGVIALLTKTYELLFLCVIFAGIGYTAYIDIKNPIE